MVSVSRMVLSQVSTYVVSATSGDVVTPAFEVPFHVSLLESACTPTMQDCAFAVVHESMDGELYMTEVGFAEMLPDGHTAGTVALTELEYADVPFAFSALTVYECTEPAVKPVCVKEVAGPWYTTVDPSRRMYLVAPDVALHEICICPVPHEPGAAESPEGEAGGLPTHCATDVPPPTGIARGNDGDHPVNVYPARVGIPGELTVVPMVAFTDVYTEGLPPFVLNE